jgi:CDP-diacylglycerol---glycerol-3-phosphate 3-phosphatidyltransferase
LINVANVVTVGRVVVALATVPLLWQSGDRPLWIAFGLTAFVIYADALDGYLARKLNQTSKLGGVLDIASDRCVEMVYWIVFAILQWIPVWVALLFLVRGTFVDAVRSVLSEKGYTAFGANTMMQSPLGKFLVTSNFSRFSYAVAKAVAFCLLIAAHTTLGAKYSVAPVAMGFVYFSAVFCLLRGLPVLIEARELF